MYKRLASDEDAPKASPLLRPGECCPYITRIRLMTALGISLITTILLLVQCIGPSMLRTADLLCCHGNQVLHTVQPNRGNLSQEDEDYAEYDEDLDGATRIHYKHTKRRLPQALIIGVRKAGTRALLEFLNLHPNIQAEKKEMHFFDDDTKYVSGLEWYRKKMPYTYGDQITIEKTPAYFVEELVPERIYKMNNSIRLLLVVRNPVERTISDYMQIHSSKLKKGKYHDTFEDIVIDRPTGTVNKNYKGIRRSIYHHHMERWLHYFPLQQFHIVHGERLVSTPWEELVKVETFLGLEHRLNHENFYYNQTKGFYCMHLQSKEKCLASSKGRQHPMVRTDVLLKLSDFFRPHNQKFYEMVGIDFGWE